MTIKHHNLKKIGWSELEIEKTFKILRKHEEKNPGLHKNLENTTIWILLVLTILANFIISYAILPIFILMNSILAIIVIIIIGLFFGAFISQIIKDVEKKFHHHLILLIIIPISAFINILIMAVFANEIAQTIKLKTINPIISAIIFSVCFLIPYIFYFYKEIKETTQKK